MDKNVKSQAEGDVKDGDTSGEVTSRKLSLLLMEGYVDSYGCGRMDATTAGACGGEISSAGAWAGFCFFVGGRAACNGN